MQHEMLETVVSHRNATPTPTGFTSSERDMVGEDEIQLLTVGVDIGSSTSHLVFSRITLRRNGNRYEVADRSVVQESAVTLTPYRDGGTAIDGDALAVFVNEQYEQAGIERSDVDAGALILTGAALQRENSRAIADLFASEAGRFVAVSAGDHLEALLAAQGSGALGLSADGETVLSVDIGGGTTKLVECVGGKPRAVAAVDVGARLVAVDEQGIVVRLEPAGCAMGQAIGLDLEVGKPADEGALPALASYMADRLEHFIAGRELTTAEQAILRTERPVWGDPAPRALVFSGGVSEFVYGRAEKQFGDLGALLGAEIRKRVERLGFKVLSPPRAGIRATVIGASQYTVQVSGTTIFVSPQDVLPVRNVSVVRPELHLDGDTIDASAIAEGISSSLRQIGWSTSEQPVALALRWEGMATYGRIDGFCRGVVAGLGPVLGAGHPLILVFEGDVGGLFGIHLKETLDVEVPVISIDGIGLSAFDFIDVGELLHATGAVPVVVKSLVFPTHGHGPSLSHTATTPA